MSASCNRLFVFFTPTRRPVENRKDGEYIRHYVREANGAVTVIRPCKADYVAKHAVSTNLERSPLESQLARIIGKVCVCV